MYDQPRKLDSERLFARHVAVSAQFRTLGRARRAVWALTNYTKSVYVAGDAEARANSWTARWPAEIRGVARAGIALGVIGALVFLALSYFGTLSVASDAGVHTGTLILLGFLVAGLAGALGWFAGALYRLYQLMIGASGHELKAVIAETALPDVEQALLRAGAITVWVLGSESELNGKFNR